MITVPKVLDGHGCRVLGGYSSKVLEGHGCRVLGGHSSKVLDGAEHLTLSTEHLM